MKQYAVNPSRIKGASKKGNGRRERNPVMTALSSLGKPCKIRNPYYAARRTSAAPGSTWIPASSSQSVAVGLPMWVYYVGGSSGVLYKEGQEPRQVGVTQTKNDGPTGLLVLVNLSPSSLAMKTNPVGSVPAGQDGSLMGAFFEGPPHRAGYAPWTFGYVACNGPGEDAIYWGGRWWCPKAGTSSAERAEMIARARYLLNPGETMEHLEALTPTPTPTSWQPTIVRAPPPFLAPTAPLGFTVPPPSAQAMGTLGAPPPPGQTTPQGVPVYPVPQGVPVYPAPQGVPVYPVPPPSAQPGMAPFLGQAQPSVTAMGMLTAGQTWPPAKRSSGGRRRTRRNVMQACVIRTVTSVAPNSGTATMLIPVTITGTGFQTGDAVTFFNNLGEQLIVLNVVIVSDTSATADVSVNETSTLGSYDVQVGPNNCALALRGGFVVT